MEIKFKESIKWIVAFFALLLVFAWISSDSDPQPLTSQGKPVTATQSEADLFKDSFIEGCMSEDGTRNYCRCVYDKFDALYTLEEQYKVSREYARSGLFPQNVTDAAVDCALLEY